MITTTRVESKTVTGSDIRAVADDIWQCAQLVYERYGKEFPDSPGMRHDLGQILLWDMADKVCIQIYDEQGYERLAYEFIPEANSTAVSNAPEDFPVYSINPSWRVRLVAVYTTRKAREEVREFFEQLGWRDAPALTRSAAGSTERYGSFRSGGYGVGRYVYRDIAQSGLEVCE